QAEDGIRDFHVTGVQTCALPICEQSALQRRIVYLTDRFQYSDKGNLGFMFLNSDLHYETPGGLTFEQKQTNRRQARPGTAVMPGALSQQAGIYNRMVLGGISHRYIITTAFSHFISVQGTYNDFWNPFITNYEQRYERNLAFRTHFNFETATSNSFFQTRSEEHTSELQSRENLVCRL